LDPQRSLADPAVVDERELLRRYHLSGDQSARTALVERMLPLVRHIARRYANRGESLDDLEQVGSVGLLKAIDRFDLDRQVKLATFAAPNIAGEIKRHFRDRGWSVRVPRDVQELHARISIALERLTVSLGRSPTTAEIARATDSTAERVLDAMQGAHAYSAVSLDEPVGEERDAFETLGGVDENYERAERRAVLSQGFDVLGAREREILRLRFFDGLTQREIAERVGISQMHVSRLIRRSLEMMRDEMDGAGELVA
jgi:RNA polymerase sigma-B factor